MQTVCTRRFFSCPSSAPENEGNLIHDFGIYTYVCKLYVSTTDGKLTNGGVKEHRRLRRCMVYYYIQFLRHCLCPIHNSHRYYRPEHTRTGGAQSLVIGVMPQCAPAWLHPCLPTLLSSLLSPQRNWEDGFQILFLTSI